MDDRHLQYAVMVGVMDHANDPTCVHIVDELAAAEEVAQHIPHAWIARRTVTVDGRERDPAADPHPYIEDVSKESNPTTTSTHVAAA